MNEKGMFLLDLLISKIIEMPATNDPAAFILYYRLDAETAEKVMNEVAILDEEVEAGVVVTSDLAMQRVGKFYSPTMGSGGPVLFVLNALKAWAPDAWERVWSN